jgi:hypothetical protein
MKKQLIHLMTILLFEIFSSGAQAQTEPNPQQHLSAETKNPLSLNDIFDHRINGADPSITERGLKIHGNERFDFYQLPIDNMICAVPNGKTKMPISLYDPKSIPDRDKMPNAFPGFGLKK